MRVCPRCRVEYSPEERFCRQDQSVLVEPVDLERIGTRVGNYFLLDILGRGGMGTVYRGEHVYIGKKVAVKVLHPRFAKYEEAIQRFLREARAASSVQHPNIVDVTDFGPMPDGGVFFVMEHLEGTSLEDMIEKQGPIPLHRALNIANQIALALAMAHDKGVIHRDLKPENIMLIEKPGRREIVRAIRKEAGERAPTAKFVVEKENKYDFVKLLDFGIAKMLATQQGETIPGQTMQGAVFGTPEYMSPEAARGQEVDHRADVYSLGVILFDMLTGRPPFEADAASAVLDMQINRPAPSPRKANPHVEITASAEQLILRAMNKNPNERHQSMDDFRDELQLCYGSIAFKRNAAAIMGSHAVPNASSRARPLTDEINEWMSSGEPQLSMDDARALAVANAAGRTFSESMPIEEQERLARAVDHVLEDDED